MGGDLVDDEGFSAVSHDLDTKTPVCETSLDKGMVHKRRVNQVGVITLNREDLFDRAGELSVDHLRFLWV
ncbi:MAG: hypothetical protein ABI618_14150, partial [Nitrospirota bacterium]